MKAFELAQLNIAHLVAPIDSPELVEFVANIDRINQCADASPGFVWRLQTDEGDATAIDAFGDEYIVNMSIWQDMESLFEFVYQSSHIEIMRRRKEWFQRMEFAYSVLWWVKSGHRPDLDEAKHRLHMLQELGPSPEAFTFRQNFPPPSHTSDS